MGYIEGTNRQQLILMNTLDDLVNQDNMVRLIDTLVDSICKALSLDSIDKVSLGRNPYRKTMLVKLYIYGYFNRISSSRRLESETQRNIELIWLLSGLTPDHWTISNFRKENGELIKEVTNKFREYLIERGYIGMKRVAVDGSKIKANSKRGMLDIKKIEKRLEGLETNLDKYIKALEENDAQEDNIEIDENDTNNDRDIIKEDKLEELDKLNAEIRKLKEAKERLITQNRKYISLTDPEADLMKTTDGKLPAYNVQAVVDDKYHMIAYSEVTTEQSDSSLSEKVISNMNNELRTVPKEALFDGGYYNPDVIERIEAETGIDCYVSPIGKKEGKISFRYDREKDEYICSEGKILKLFSKNKRKKKSLANVYRGIECNGCIKRNDCTTSKEGRMVHRYNNQDYREKYLEKMSSRESKQKIKKRKTIIEHTFGTLKVLMGKIPLLLRGVKKVATEINIYAMVYNIKRLINIEKVKHLVDDLLNYKWRFA